MTKCDPQYANDDGWTDWIQPVPHGYLMQCCGCDLIHEVEFRVVKRVDGGTSEYTIDGNTVRAQFRMKRIGDA